jgi:hypothetical protein
MPNIISKIIMWLAWWFGVAQAFFMAHYLTGGSHKLNTFARPLDAFVIAMFLIPLVIGGGLRLWMLWIRNPWLALLPFFGGILFAWLAELFGIFLFPEFWRVFQVLCAALFVAYLPFLAPLRQRPPPIPASKG